MSGIKWAAIGLWLVLAVIVAVAGRRLLTDLPLEVSGPVAVSHRWLLVMALLYAGNYAVAWLKRNSFKYYLVRSLVWALIAYLCVTNIVDILGANYPVLWQILGLETVVAEKDVIIGLRCRLGVWATGLGMGIMCIAVGFEDRAVNSIDESHQ